MAGITSTSPLRLSFCRTCLFQVSLFSFFAVAVAEPTWLCCDLRGSPDIHTPSVVYLATWRLILFNPSHFALSCLSFAFNQLLLLLASFWVYRNRSLARQRDLNISPLLLPGAPPSL